MHGITLAAILLLGICSVDAVNLRSQHSATLNKPAARAKPVDCYGTANKSVTVDTRALGNLFGNAVAVTMCQTDDKTEKETFVQPYRINMFAAAREMNRPFYGMYATKQGAGFPEPLLADFSPGPGFNWGYGGMHVSVMRSETAFVPGTPVSACSSVNTPDDVRGPRGLDGRPAAFPTTNLPHDPPCTLHYETSTGMRCTYSGTEDDGHHCKASVEKETVFRERGGVCIISIRGTQFSNTHDGWNTILADVEMKQWDLGDPSCKGCQVHNGFWQDSGLIYDAIKDTLDDFKCSSHVVVGHSLGAAVASLVAWRYYSDHKASSPPDVTVYAFESPRFANKEFRNEYDKRIPLVRTSHLGMNKHGFQDFTDIDVIAMLPLFEIETGPVPRYFFHAGIEVMLQDGSRVPPVCCESSCDDHNANDPRTDAKCQCSRHIAGQPTPLDYDNLGKVMKLHLNFEETDLKYYINSAVGCPFSSGPPADQKAGLGECTVALQAFWSHDTKQCAYNSNIDYMCPGSLNITDLPDTSALQACGNSPDSCGWKECHDGVCSECHHYDYKGGAEIIFFRGVIPNSNTEYCKCPVNTTDKPYGRQPMPGGGGCYKAHSAEECCSSYDDRGDDYYQGSECVPALSGVTFASGNTCEPAVWVRANAWYPEIGTCDLSPPCTALHKDPYQAGLKFPNGTAKAARCCDGLEMVKEDWDHDGRWYYRCEEATSPP